MPRIHDKNPRYRSKDEICSDIAFVLNSPLKHGTKHAVLSEVMWVWTEFKGKYDGCEYWSEAAWVLKNQKKMLVHEHVVPKSIVMDRLRDLLNPTTESVKQVLTQYCVGAVITRKEDASLNKLKFRSKMPEGWDEKDVWARYTAAGIVVRSHAS